MMVPRRGPEGGMLQTNAEYMRIGAAALTQACLSKRACKREVQTYQVKRCELGRWKRARVDAQQRGQRRVYEPEARCV